MTIISNELTFEYPKHLEHPFKRINLTAADLLEYWAKQGAIPHYNGLIEGLRISAAEIDQIAQPIENGN